MSDEKKDAHEGGDAKKDDKKAAEGAAKGGGIKALMGPILAVVVLIGAGIGIGMFLSSFLAKPPEKTAAKPAHGAEGGHGGGDGHEGGGGHNLLHSSKEMVIDDIVANVKDTGGKRFVKVSPSFYLIPEAAEPLGLNGGGHGGGEVGGEIKRILKARIEEHLKQYDMEELTSQAVYKRMEKSFKDIAEKEMRSFAPDLPMGKPVVMKVVLAGLVVQ